jgi:(1->4)-alpha-D-glucan 1-alpha-D-glucosylmutase
VDRLRERGDLTPVSERVARVLLLEEPNVDREAALRFVRRFQQTIGPATAKGVEDTALYLYVPLVSRNEVGGDPERPLDDPPAQVHAANRERAERWPLALVTTNTHDTKRSADVRARVDVLTELPREWSEAVARWRRVHRTLGRTVKGRHAPGANAEYLLYQTLLGVWPLPGARGEAADPAALRQRVEEYMLKAAREGKARTSWTDADEEYETTLKGFVGALLSEDAGAHFREEMTALVARVAHPGLWNALARAVVHLTVPGTPDIYQGDELWNFALVDPDNRRPVDYQLRARLLDELDRRAATDGGEQLVAALMRTPEDGRVKLHVMRGLLQLRRAHPELFAAGSYEPLEAVGAAARHVFAFARRLPNGPAAITIVPRLPLTLMRGEPGAPLGAQAWGDTAVADIPAELASARWRNALTGAECPVGTLDAAPTIRVADALKTLPGAVLVAG